MILTSPDVTGDVHRVYTMDTVGRTLHLYGLFLMQQLAGAVLFLLFCSGTDY